MGAKTQVLVNGTRELGFAYPDGYDPALSAQEVLVLQDRFLIEQLRLLTDRRASDDSKSDALEWVATPLVRGEESPYLGPLSFQRCCLEAHNADPATVQERVLRRIAPDRLAELGYE